jgi:two-component system NarL family sensor kinase
MLVPVPVQSSAIESALAGMQERLGERFAHLERSERRLRQLAAVSRKMAARAAKLQVEKERQRLGRELHTGVGQLLAAVRIQVELIDQYLPERPRAVSEALERIGALASEALDQVRAVSRELYLPEWQRIPLPQAIASLWDRSGMKERFGGKLKLGPLACAPDPARKALVYRAAQEALSNVVRHSRATEVELALEYSDGRLLLTVEDNGVGMGSTQETGPEAGGIGLRALRDEAAALGAELTLEDRSPGTRLRLSAPC